MATQKKVRKPSAQRRSVEQARRIAETAYRLWDERGRLHGEELRDWLEAESIVSELSDKPGR